MALPALPAAGRHKALDIAAKTRDARAMDKSPSDNEIVGELLLFEPRLHGNTKRPLVAEYVRDLTAADLAALEAPRGSRPSALKRISASHHSLAKCLASGMKPMQASLVTGYDLARISILQSDPTFQELVRDYREETKSWAADLAARMSDLSLDAMEELQRRLHEAPESFSIQTLLETVRTFADRTGHGPGSEVNLRLTPADLIDRPPRETHDEWTQRRQRELEADNSLGTPTRPSNGSNNGRLVS